MKKLPYLIAVLVCSISLSAMAQGNGMATGNVRILEVKGSAARVIQPDGLSAPAKSGEFIREGASIKTGSGTSVALLFDNGALVVVTQNSEFSIEQFLTKPFDYEGLDYKTLTKEPAQSTTKLKVSEGLVGVDSLRLDGKSKFQVSTPLGTAGIRGTRFGVNSSQANNSSGVVVVSGEVSVTNRGGQTQVLGNGMGIGMTPGGFESMAQQFFASVSQLISQLLQALRPTIPTNPFAGAPSQAPAGGDVGTDDTGDQGSITAGQTLPGSGNRPSQP